MNVERLGHDGGDARHRASYEMLERSNRVHLLEYRASAHSVLESGALETTEHERGDTRVEPRTRDLGRGALGGATLRKMIAGRHRAQG
jgi:hypothetical protein